MSPSAVMVTLTSLLPALVFSLPSAAAQEMPPAPPAPSVFTLSPPGLSRAFINYRKRPASELSKLLYLVDRLGESDLQIVYEKNTYPSRIIMPVARWYLHTHYNRKDSAENWITESCYRTLGSGEPVWVKYQDGSLRQARDILLEELDLLQALS